jgi:putative Mn2+ efflux pump MntP
MFSILELILIGIALALDCLTVSIAAGIAHKKPDIKYIIAISYSFGLFQAIMPIIGWQTTVIVGDFINDIDHWIAFFLLAYLGWKMIRNSDENVHKSFHSKSLLLILSLSIATSIDALAIGISFTCVGYKTIEDIILPIVIIGIISFIFALIGYITGVLIGKKAKISIEKYGGIMLIIIGFKILIEHLL